MTELKKNYIVEELININKEIKEILKNHKKYLNSFKNDNGTFFTGKKDEKIHLTSTVTCTNSLIKSKQDEEINKDVLYNILLKEKWRSADLVENNFYTSTVLLNGLNKLKPSLKYQNSPEKIQKRLDDIKDKIKKDGGLNVVDYPINAFVTFCGFLSYEAYNGKAQTIEDLKEGIIWFERELYRQLALFYARDDYEKDIYQLGYSLIGLLKYNETINPNIIKKTLTIIFKDQKENGSWDRYNALFYYPAGGNAYCYTFELLKNIFLIPDKYMYILNEHISHFERAKNWIKNYEQIERSTDKTSGWCSYHHTDWREPESWATASVFEFLHCYNKLIENSIKNNLLDYFKAKIIPLKDNWTELLDIEICIKGGKIRLKKVIEDSIIKPIQDKKDIHAYGLLFFGLTGTGKTQYAKGIAEQIGWPLIILNPSHFLSEGFAGIVRVATLIFKKFEYLGNVVVLFDEMDELMKSRNDLSEYESRIFTTSMLPMIAELHDKNNFIYIYNTNLDYDKIDEAIKRPARFDFNLCFGPPCYSEIIKFIPQKLKKNGIGQDNLKLINSFIEDAVNKPKLERFFFFEILDLINAFTNDSFSFHEIDLLNKIKGTFEQVYKSIILSKEENYSKFIKERNLSILNARKS